MPMRHIWWAGLLLVACGGPGAGPVTRTGSTTSTLEPNATVERVVDGDTIVARIDGNEERVRLIGIDTPEAERADRGTPAECLADEATAFTGRLVPPGTPIRLERDIVARDDYGRLLAYVHRASDGLFVNLEIVQQGYARPLTIPPNDTYSDRFVEAARHAEARDRGLWSACTG